MKKGFVCLLGATLLFPIQSALAEMSWYLGVGGGLTSLHTSSFASASGLDSPAIPTPPPTLITSSVNSGEFKDNPIGWQVYGGMQFTENFGLVVKYSDSGKAKDQWNAFTDALFDEDGSILTTVDQVSVLSDYSFTGDMEMDGFTIYLTQTVPLGDKFEYGIEVGWTRQDIEFQWNSTVTSSLSPSPLPPGVTMPPLPTSNSGIMQER